MFSLAPVIGMWRGARQRVDQAHADQLFQPSLRLHSPEAFAGHGIDPTSAKRTVERHGGRIRAEGQAGQGATFVSTLGDAFEDAPDTG